LNRRILPPPKRALYQAELHPEGAELSHCLRVQSIHALQARTKKCVAHADAQDAVYRAPSPAGKLPAVRLALQTDQTTVDPERVSPEPAQHRRVLVRVVLQA
jgi:hypothetical protein